MKRLTALFAAAAVTGAAIIYGQQGPEFSSADITRMIFSGEHGLIDLPVCLQEDGQPTRYDEQSIFDILHNTGNVLAYVKKGRDGRPYITYASDMMASLPPVMQEFAFAHECHHVQRGHVSGHSPLDEQEREDEADCLALTDMVRAGRLDWFDLREIARYNRAMTQAFRPGEDKMEATHQRNARLEACYFNALQ